MRQDHGTAAIKAMANIQQQVDVFMRGQSTPVTVLMNICQIVGTYQGETQ